MSWTDADFDAMSWHDVHVYGFRVFEISGGQGAADLVFDLDYILQWLRPPPGQPFQFEVAQASLRFHHARNLQVALDYKTPTAGMGPFSLDGISRTRLEGRDGWSWLLEANWPAGRIAFTQTLVGPARTQGAQHLESAYRV